MREVFERHGLRCTRQREQIYSALASTKDHPTVDELFTRVREFEPGLSLATVYNTLEAFTECGIVRRIPTQSAAGPARYDADTSEHVHLTTNDGRVIDVPNDLSSRLIEALPSPVLAELERRLSVRIGSINVQLVAQPRRTPERHPAD